MKSAFPRTREGMKDDLRQYMRRYHQMHSDDLLHDIRTSWPDLFETEIKAVLNELVTEGFLCIQGSGDKFIATLGPNATPLQ